MVRVEHSVVFNLSAEKLFAALTDFENSPRWQPEVIEERLVTTGPLGVGSRVFQARKFRGQRIESTSEVVEFEPNRKMVNVGLPEVVPSLRTQYQLVPEGNSTRLTFFIELKGKGFFRLIEPLIKRTLKRDVETRFQTLKSQLEAYPE